jgi:lipopolysaccharide export system protein LptA
MIKYILLLTLFTLSIFAQELQIKANSFKADEKLGVSIFSGNVNIIKKNDELNASEVVIHVDKKNQPTKFIATGKVSFIIETKHGSKYKGKAGQVVFIPKTKEYRFFNNVHLEQVDEKKEILGDEVILNTTDGKAYAKGLKKDPVIMIFNIKEQKD